MIWTRVDGSWKRIQKECGVFLALMKEAVGEMTGHKVIEYDQVLEWRRNGKCGDVGPIERSPENNRMTLKMYGIESQ